MEHDEIVALKNQLSATFTIDQLRQVVWEAGVDPENIAHTNLSSLARETANHFNRNMRIPTLLKACAKMAPTVDWSRWGGEPPTEDLWAVLRQLLNVACSSSDLYTLAFDVLPGSYEEIKSAQSKARALEMIVATAVKENKVLPLMERVRGINPYQYAQFFERVDRALIAYRNAPPPPPPPAKPKTGTVGGYNMMLMVIRHYANGGTDGGQLARNALNMLGEALEE